MLFPGACNLAGRTPRSRAGKRSVLVPESDVKRVEILPSLGRRRDSCRSKAEAVSQSSSDCLEDSSSDSRP